MIIEDLLEIPKEEALTKLESEVSDLYFDELITAKNFKEWKEIEKRGIYTPERYYRVLRLI